VTGVVEVHHNARRNGLQPLEDAVNLAMNGGDIGATRMQPTVQPPHVRLQSAQQIRRRKLGPSRLLLLLQMHRR